MENQKKIVHLLLFSVLLVGCTNGPKKKVDSSKAPNQPISAIEMYEGHVENRDGKRVFLVRSINSEDSQVEEYCSIQKGTAQFTGCINPFGDTISIHEMIDSASFSVVGLKEDEKQKIRNPYFFDGRMHCYYFDDVNFFAYLDQDSPDFLLLGKKSETELLGGSFVRVADQIFVQGIKIDSADVNTFHTMEVFWSEKTEWSRTIGLDKNHIYISEKPLTEERFYKLITPNDSLRNIYFP
ncbi:MAG: hypothetical protein AB8B56_21890 [Crocinitomicaceae bacterium]